MCRSQSVGIACDRDGAPGRLLGMTSPRTGPWQQGSSSDFKVPSLLCCHKDKNNLPLYYFSLSRKLLALLPHWAILEHVPSAFTSLVPVCRDPVALWASKQRCRRDLVISQLKTLPWFPVAWMDNSKLLSLAYKDRVLGPLPSPASVLLTMNPSSGWTSRVSITAELLQVQFPCHASTENFSPF